MKKFNGFMKKMMLLPIKIKLISYFILFVMIILAVLWIFQTLFLESFYKYIKTEQIKNYSKTITDNVYSNNLQDYILSIYEQSDINVSIYNPETSQYLEINRADDELMLVARNATNNSYYQNYLRCKENGGTLIIYSENDDFRKFEHDIPIFGDGPRPEREHGAETIMYCSLIELSTSNEFSQNAECLLILHTVISPVTSVVDTLQFLLIFSTIILLSVAIMLALYVSSKISKPISSINKSAKELARQNYNVKFDGSGAKETMELAQTLNFATNELSKVDMLQKELVSNISHDLRTPLTMITGYCEMMRDLPGENSPENLQIIIDEATYLSKLVFDLLDISKLQAGTLTLEKAEYNLTDSIHKLLDRYTKLREQEGFHINFVADSDVFITADELKITQVLYNLINNAINYAGEDKTVIVRQVTENNRITIEVEDHGAGIKKEELPYIWERYYKVDKSSSHKRAVGGTGLGLSIVKKILDLHKFDYGVKSEEGNGSIFWFSVPL